MIFRSPFFFLLVDSFFLSPLPPVGEPSCAVPEFALAASEVCSAPAAASVLGAVSLVPVPVAPLAPSLVAAGAFGSAADPAFGALPSVAGALLSAALVVPLLLPGVTVATIPVRVPPPPICDWLPPASMSVPASVSDSGVIVGFPTLAADRNSSPGPL